MFVAQMIVISESIFVNLNWLFPKPYLLVMLPKRLVNMPHVCKILKSNETIDLHKISKHSKSRSQNSAQATEIIKKCIFCKNSHHSGNALPTVKFAITVIGKTILRSAVLVIEKLSPKLNKLKLNHLLTNSNFSLIR